MSGIKLVSLVKHKELAMKSLSFSHYYYRVTGTGTKKFVE